MTICRVQDETCRACIFCEGGQFIPVEPWQCECDGSGCTTHSKCEHGVLKNGEDGCMACEARRGQSRSEHFREQHVAGDL